MKKPGASRKGKRINIDLAALDEMLLKLFRAAYLSPEGISSTVVSEDLIVHARMINNDMVLYRINILLAMAVDDVLELEEKK